MDDFSFNDYNFEDTGYNDYKYFTDDYYYGQKKSKHSRPVLTGTEDYYTSEENEDNAKARTAFHKEVRKKTTRNSILSFLLTAGTLIGGTALICFVALQSYVMTNNSMAPNICTGEHVLVDKLSYKIIPPKRGDVVSVNNNPVRIIGLPGETIQFSNGSIFIDGRQAMEAAYIDTNMQTSAEKKKYTVGENEYFVLFDDRDQEGDSRSGQNIPLSMIDGKVIGAF